MKINELLQERGLGILQRQALGLDDELVFNGETYKLWSEVNFRRGFNIRAGVTLNGEPVLHGVIEDIPLSEPAQQEKFIKRVNAALKKFKFSPDKQTKFAELLNGLKP